MKISWLKPGREGSLEDGKRSYVRNELVTSASEVLLPIWDTSPAVSSFAFCRSCHWWLRAGKSQAVASVAATVARIDLGSDRRRCVKSPEPRCCLARKAGWS